MFALLRGYPEIINESSVVLNVRDVGYLVRVSIRCANMMKKDEQVALLIETSCLEGDLKLFGFIEEEEKQWFKLLTKIKGIGGKAALSILGHFSPEELSIAIETNNIVEIAKSPGIGKRTAERIIMELKNKKTITSDKKDPILRDISTKNNARDALISLGWPEIEANKAIAVAVAENSNYDLNSLVKISLRILNKV